MDLTAPTYFKTEPFTVPPDAPRSEKTVRYRGLVCRTADRAVLLRCPHAHRGSMAAHKCVVKLWNERRADGPEPTNGSST